MVSSTTPSSGEYLLEMSGINKSFPGVKALDNVNLKVRPHSIHALMGENGAGKSTLLKCLFGIYQKDSGTILFQGKEIDFHSAKEALENGISMVHQELNLVLQRSVMDNMWLGRYPTKGMFVDQDKMYRETKAIFDELDIGKGNVFSKFQNIFDREGLQKSNFIGFAIITARLFFKNDLSIFFD